jgi:hypothetical protein
MNKKTGNKGEWSEFYVLLKLLTEQRLYAADEDLNKIENIFYIVLAIIAGKNSANERIYELSDKLEEIKIFNPTDGTFKTIGKTVIRNKLRSIFQVIKDSDKTFAIEEAEELREQLDCFKIKAESNKKTDIVLKIHDLPTGTQQEMGFSVKSLVGSDPTLLNAGQTTNFIFEIEGGNIDPEKINSIETKTKILDRVQAIHTSGGRLKFSSLENSTFQKNLQYVDTLMPEILAEILKIYYSGGHNQVTDVVNILKELNPLNNDLRVFNPDLYEHKIKEFLSAVALGMMPSKPWDGKIETLGGYIIVKEDGEIVCYHLFNMNQFREYLFTNTRMERGGTKKHKFCRVYHENGKNYIKLNLQVRFNN